MRSTRLPLPLELTTPVALAGRLNEQFTSTYDPTAQLCSSTSSHMRCKSVDRAGIQVDVTVDVQVDDVLA